MLIAWQAINLLFIIRQPEDVGWRFWQNSWIMSGIVGGGVAFYFLNVMSNAKGADVIEIREEFKRKTSDGRLTILGFPTNMNFTEQAAIIGASDTDNIYTQLQALYEGISEYGADQKRASETRNKELETMLSVIRNKFRLRMAAASIVSPEQKDLKVQEMKSNQTKLFTLVMAGLIAMGMYFFFKYVYGGG